MGKLCVAHVNIRSLVPSFADLKCLLLHEEFHILAVTETWLSPEYPDALVDVPGYQLFRMDRVSRGGGIGVYVSTGLKCRVIDVSAVPGGASLVEQLWIEVVFRNTKILVGSLYRPPMVHYKQLSCIENLLSVLSVSYNCTILMGDLNINWLVTNLESSYLKSLLQMFNLNQVITDPTRLTRNSCSLIDIICVENDTHIVDSGTMEMFNLTDHRLVYSTLGVESPKATDRVITYRDFRNFNEQLFDLEMQAFDSCSVLQHESMDTRLEVFNRRLTEVFDRHAPIKTTQIRRKHKPYITDTIKDIIKLKKGAFNKYKRTGNAAHRDYYLDIKNYLSFAIRSEKKAYMAFELGKVQQNSKKLWNKINDWSIHSKRSNEIPSHLKNVDQIGAHFASVCRLAVPVDNFTLEFFKNNRFDAVEDRLFSFRIISECDVYRAFARIKSHSMGIDSISYSMLLFSIKHVVGLIVDLFNFCLRNGDFPTIWKTSIVRPLPKAHKIESLSELRPISLLPILSKMLEGLVSEMMNEFISVNSILPKIQSGFRRGHSTATALSKVSTDIAKHMDGSKVSCLVLLDYSKAFDLINHDMLIAKVKYFGFSEQVCAWLSSYLFERAQMVDLEGVRSRLVSIKQGVPQGSILGPLLFSLYTSDLPRQVRFCSVHLYADDTQLLAGFAPENACWAMQEVNGDLDRIFKWSCNHGLLLNANKSNYLMIGANAVKSKFLLHNFVTLHINGSLLPAVEHARNLGVIFDGRLDFEQHVKGKLSAVYFKLKSLYSFKYLLPESLKLVLVESLIYPHLDYCNVVYYNYLTVEFQNKIQLAQNACIRFVYSINRSDHVTPVYIQNGLLKYKLRAMLHLGVFTYGIYRSRCPEYLCDCIVARQGLHDLNLRNIVRFNIPQHRTSKFRSSFSFLVVDLLNSEVFDLILGNALPTFKRKYKSHLLQSMML